MKKKFIKTELIEKYLQDNKLSKTGFCKKCKISPSTLKKVMEQNANVGIVGIFKIAFAMNLRTCDIFCDEK